MPSPEHEQLVQTMSAQAEDIVGASSIGAQRANFEAMTKMFSLAGDVRTETVKINTCPAEWITTPDSEHDRVVLYLHGGGYVIGSLNTHRELAARIARAAQARVLLLDYRLAPEHPFPAAVEDATAAYQWLLEQGLDAADISIAGDSAGGGLTLATLLSLKAKNIIQPASAVCLSPWIDLECTGESCQPGAVDDPFVTLEGLQAMSAHYTSDANRRDPLASPLYGNYEGLPPLLIQVGTREILLSDALRTAEKAKAAGVEVTLEQEEGLIHVWQLFPMLPESEQAVTRIGTFIREHID